MRKVGFLVLALFFVFSGAAFAAVESIRVSGDINAGAVARDLGMGIETGQPGSSSETFAFSQVRLRIDADLTEGVGATIGLINERLWGNDSGDNEIDLDLAYIQLDNFMEQPLTVKIGRQNLRYGNALIIGDPNTNQFSPDAPPAIGDLSLRKSFDAARVILDYAPYTVDLVYAKIDEGETNLRDDTNLWGLNVGYDWSNEHGVTEGYLFYADKGRKDTSVVPPIHQDFKEYTTTVGARTQFHLSEQVTLGLEGAYQFGKVDTSAYGWAIGSHNRKAFAGQFIGQYRFLDDYNSAISLGFTYLSGNNDESGSYNAWDPLFEDQVPAEIANLLFPHSNVLCATLTGSMMPQEDLTLTLHWAWLKLADAYNVHPSIYSPLVGPASGNSYAVNRDKTSAGNEVNASLLYDYTEDLQFKLTGAWFMPGSFFQSDNDSLAYSLRAGINVSF